MLKKLLIIVLIEIVVGGAILGFLWWKTEQPELPPTVKEEEALKEIIKKNIKQEFRPSAYEVSQNDKYAYFVFGPSFKELNYYLTQWSSGKNYFTTLVGYDKRKPDDLMGYGIVIHAREPEIKGKVLAQKFLKNVPEDSWESADPREWKNGETGEIEKISEISCVISELSKDKAYLSVIPFNHLKPETYHLPEEELINNIGVVSYIVYTLSNPLYKQLKNVQKTDLLVFGSKSNE